MNDINRQLENSILSLNPDTVEKAVFAMYEHGVEPAFSKYLIKLLGIDWHTRHEDIVTAIQELKCPEAIDILFATATKQFNYLEYDEFYGLARKCTWALADIGTDKALKKLKLLSENGNQSIAQHAQKRIDNWALEMDRKRISET